MEYFFKFVIFILVIKLNIFYNNNVLYVTLSDEVNEYNIEKLKRRVFKIISDYDIDNIYLKFLSVSKDNYLIDNFLNEYNSKFNGHITID